eukprot:6181878-Pyramimonas_sp.AAC.1
MLKPVAGVPVPANSPLAPRVGELGAVDARLCPAGLLARFLDGAAGFPDDAAGFPDGAAGFPDGAAGKLLLDGALAGVLTAPRDPDLAGSEK